MIALCLLTVPAKIETPHGAKVHGNHAYSMQEEFFFSELQPDHNYERRSMKWFSNI